MIPGIPGGVSVGHIAKGVLVDTVDVAGADVGDASEGDPDVERDTEEVAGVISL